MLLTPRMRNLAYACVRFCRGQTGDLNEMFHGSEEQDDAGQINLNGRITNKFTAADFDGLAAKFDPNLDAEPEEVVSITVYEPDLAAYVAGQLIRWRCWFDYKFAGSMSHTFTVDARYEGVLRQAIGRK